MHGLTGDFDIPKRSWKGRESIPDIGLIPKITPIKVCFFRSLRPKESLEALEIADPRQSDFISLHENLYAKRVVSFSVGQLDTVSENNLSGFILQVRAYINSVTIHLPLTHLNFKSASRVDFVLVNWSFSATSLQYLKTFVSCPL